MGSAPEQLHLDRRRWGGRRPGAGRKPHLIVEARDRFALGRGMKSIAARLARAVNRVFGRRGPVLADRYHLRVLRTPREVRNSLAYVLLNARRHAAKAGRRIGRAVRLDPASSGRWFDGWRPDLRPRSGAHAPSVAPPRKLAADSGLATLGTPRSERGAGPMSNAGTRG